MSTFTKILIVLLTLASFSLCASVLVWVGTSSNYKDELGDLQNDYKILKEELVTQINRYNEKMAQLETREAKLKEANLSLEKDNNRLDVELKTAQMTSLDSEARAKNLAGLITGFEQDIAQMFESLELTRKQLVETQTESIRDKKDLNEITAILYQTQAQMADLNRRVKQLTEKNIILEDNIQSMESRGTMLETPGTVTQDTGPAQPALTTATISNKADIHGLVSEVSEKMVTISVGSDDGVRETMRFHVFRGVEFVCDVIITDVETNKAAGVMPIKIQPPKIGDTASTNL